MHGLENTVEPYLFVAMDGLANNSHAWARKHSRTMPVWGNGVIGAWPRKHSRTMPVEGDGVNGA